MIHLTARMRWLPLPAAGLAALTLAGPPAHADTLVFERGDAIWIAQPDGSGQRQVSTDSHVYRWPSQSDDGAIVAVDASFADGRLFRMTQRGEAIGGPIPTASSLSTSSFASAPPTHVRISPDGRLIAYDEFVGGEFTTLWTPAAATSYELPNQAIGQLDYGTPSWIGSDRLLLSHGGMTLTESQPAYVTYQPGDPDDSETAWFKDDPGFEPTSYDAAISRAGDRIAAVEVGPIALLRVFSADPSGTAAPVYRCQFTLPDASDAQYASPTFSPDGTQLAWSQADGIHVAALGGGAPSCGSQRVVIGAGAWEPYWSPAADEGPAPAPGPGPTPTPGPRATPTPTPGPSPHVTPTPSPHGTPTPSASRLTVALPSRLARGAMLKRGLTARVRCAAACRVSATLTVDARTAERARLGRRATVVGRQTLRLAHAGSAPVTIRLTAPAARRLGRLRSFAITARFTAAGARPVTRTTTVR